MKKLLIVLSGLMIPALVFATKTVTPCPEVLQSTSQEWIKKYTTENGDDTLEQVKAILRFETCFDQQLQARKEKLDESGRGPLMGMMGNFRDLEAAIKEFTHIAIRACGQDPERVRIQRAYAFLYQLQFRDYFYRQYEKTKAVPKTDLDAVKRLQQALEEQFKKENPNDAELLRNRFDKFRVLAKDLEMPMQNVYAYAVMVVNKTGALVTKDVPF